MKKNILIIFTGGTFSMKIDKETGGAIPRYSGSELLDKIPQAKKLANLICYDFGKYPGPHMTPQLMLKLSKKISRSISKNNITGVVVTHGTDTLEETAYFLDLNVKSKIPIVVIGSMKNSSEPDWDGPQNLTDAIRVCLNKKFNGLGVLVCLNGEINAASEVTKTFTDEIDTFSSMDFGPLGFIKNNKIVLKRLPRKLEKIYSTKIDAKVDMLTVYAGMDEKFFKYSADSGAHGIVIEALGVGNVPPAAFKGIEYAVKKGIPIVLVSRCPAGETLDIYSYPGAGKHLNNLGVIFVEYLNGQKARIKLMLALGKTKNKKKLKKLFAKS